MSDDFGIPIVWFVVDDAVIFDAAIVVGVVATVAAAVAPPTAAPDDADPAGLRQVALSGAMPAAAPALQRFQAAVRCPPSSGSGFRLKRETLDRHR